MKRNYFLLKALDTQYTYNILYFNCLFCLNPARLRREVVKEKKSSFKIYLKVSQFKK